MENPYQQSILTRCMAIENKVLGQSQLLERHLAEHRAFLEMLAENMTTQTWQSAETRAGQMKAVEIAARQTKNLEEILTQITEHKTLSAQNLTAKSQQASDYIKAQSKLVDSVTMMGNLLEEKLDRMMAQNIGLSEIMKAQVEQATESTEVQRQHSLERMKLQIRLEEIVSSQNKTFEMNLQVMTRQLIDVFEAQSRQNSEGMTAQTKILEDTLGQMTYANTVLNLNSVNQAQQTIEIKAIQSTLSENVASLAKLFKDNLTEITTQKKLLVGGVTAQSQKFSEILLAHSGQAAIQTRIEESLRTHTKLLESMLERKTAQNNQLSDIVHIQNQQTDKIVETLSRQSERTDVAQNTLLEAVCAQSKFLEDNLTSTTVMKHQSTEAQKRFSMENIKLLNNILDRITAQNNIIAKGVKTQTEQAEKLLEVQTQKSNIKYSTQTNLAVSMENQSKLLGDIIDRLTAQNNLLAKNLVSQKKVSMESSIAKEKLDVITEVQNNLLENIHALMTAQNNLFAESLNQQSNESELTRVFQRRQLMENRTMMVKSKIAQTKLLRAILFRISAQNNLLVNSLEPQILQSEKNFNLQIHHSEKNVKAEIHQSADPVKNQTQKNVENLALEKENGVFENEWVNLEFSQSPDHMPVTVRFKKMNMRKEEAADQEEKKTELKEAEDTDQIIQKHRESNVISNQEQETYNNLNSEEYNGLQRAENTAENLDKIRYAQYQNITDHVVVQLESDSKEIKNAKHEEQFDNTNSESEHQRTDSVGAENCGKINQKELKNINQQDGVQIYEIVQKEELQKSEVDEAKETKNKKDQEKEKPVIVEDQEQNEIHSSNPENITEEVKERQNHEQIHKITENEKLNDTEIEIETITGNEHENNEDKPEIGIIEQQQVETVEQQDRQQEIEKLTENKDETNQEQAKIMEKPHIKIMMQQENEELTKNNYKNNQEQKEKEIIIQKQNEILEQQDQQLEITLNKFEYQEKPEIDVTEKKYIEIMQQQEQQQEIKEVTENNQEELQIEIIEQKHSKIIKQQENEELTKNKYQNNQEQQQVETVEQQDQQQEIEKLKENKDENNREQSKITEQQHIKILTQQDHQQENEELTNKIQEQQEKDIIVHKQNDILEKQDQQLEITLNKFEYLEKPEIDITEKEHIQIMEQQEQQQEIEHLTENKRENNKQNEIEIMEEQDQNTTEITTVQEEIKHFARISEEKHTNEKECGLIIQEHHKIVEDKETAIPVGMESEKQHKTDDTRVQKHIDIEIAEYDGQYKNVEIPEYQISKNLRSEENNKTETLKAEEQELEEECDKVTEEKNKSEDQQNKFETSIGQSVIDNKGNGSGNNTPVPAKRNSVKGKMKTHVSEFSAAHSQSHDRTNTKNPSKKKGQK